MSQLTARVYNCERCHQQVKICSPCDRGNIYCVDCGTIARQEKQKEANHRHQKTAKGRFNNAERQNKFRAEQHKKETEEKKVTYQGSTSNTDSSSCHQASDTGAQWFQEQQSGGKCCCHFCGREVSDYLRQDFMRYAIAKTHKGSLLPAGP